MNPLKWLQHASRFEKHHQPLLSWRGFGLRLLGFFLVALIVDAVAIVLGALGLQYFEQLRWIDAFLNASMLITGNGLIHHAQSMGGKLFLIVYALTAGIVFIAVVSVLLTPIFHRILHAFSIELPDEDEEEGREAGEE